MRYLFPSLLVGCWLLIPNTGWTQTAETQKKVKDKLKQEKAATLDQLIAEALKNNPDIRVAEAKVDEVAAESDRVRVKIAADVAALCADIKAARASANEANERHERAFKLKLNGSLSEEEYGSATLTAVRLRTELAALEKRLPYLVGRQKFTEKDPIKTDSPEKLIAQALKNNPDIRVGEAKVREVAAELDRVRQRAASDVATLHGDIEAAKASLNEGEERYRRAEMLYQKGAMAKEELSSAKLTLLKLKSALAALEAKMPYLLGRSAGSSSGQSAADKALLDRAHRVYEAEWARMAALRALDQIADGPLSANLRKALDMPMQIDVANLPAKEALEALAKKLPGLNIVVRATNLSKMATNSKLKQAIPLGAQLQYFEDEFDLVFVLRDYGIVVVSAGDRLPPGAVRVVDFWKHGKTASRDKK